MPRGVLGGAKEGNGNANGFQSEAVFLDYHNFNMFNLKSQKDAKNVLLNPSATKTHRQKEIPS